MYIYLKKFPTRHLQASIKQEKRRRIKTTGQGEIRGQATVEKRKLQMGGRDIT
jgi:hypothetical protein